MMNFLVFFSTIESVERYCRYLRVQCNIKSNVTFISTKPVPEEHLNVLRLLGFSYIINDSLSEALTKASELISGKKDTIITTVDVIPVDNFMENIREAKSRIPDLSSCFGRWYNDIISDRVGASIRGFKYRDSTPKLIAHHILEHSPFPDVHAIKVSRFPVFLNYFDKKVAVELKHSLNSAVSFSEFSFFFSEFLNSYNSRRGVYYVPTIEAIDKKLL